MRCPSNRTLHTLLLLALLSIAAGSLATSQDEAISAQLLSLAPSDALTVHGLLAQRDALLRVQRQIAAGSSSTEAIVENSLHQLIGQLRALLPQHTRDLEYADDGRDSSSGDSVATALQARVAAAILASSSSPQGHQGQPSRVARALTLVNVVWFASSLILTVAITSLAGSYSAALLRRVPLMAWEAAAYTTSILVIRHALAMHTAAQAASSASQGVSSAPAYVALTGLMMLTACAACTAWAHLPDLFQKHDTAEVARAGAAALLAAVYGAVAVRLQASVIGTLAVYWAVACLGFGISASPFLTVIGFEDEGAMARCLSACVALIAAFVPFKAAPTLLPMPAALRPFETGVFLWCALAANTAALIMSHSQWDASHASSSNSSSSGNDMHGDQPRGQFPGTCRPLAAAAYQAARVQLPPLAVIGGTLACGVMLDIGQCRAVGSAFGFIWFLTKLAECNWQRVGFAWAALAVGVVLWTWAYAINSWPRYFYLQ